MNKQSISKASYSEGVFESLKKKKNHVLCVLMGKNNNNNHKKKEYVLYKRLRFT